MKQEEKIMVGILSLLFSIWFFSIMATTVPLTSAAINQTVLTKVNVSNTEPSIYNLTLPSSMTLTAGATTIVACNATIWDYNGVPNGIRNVTAILYLNSTSVSGAFKNDTKYFSNCTNITALSTTSAVYSCNFTLQYFARNGTWACNLTVIDNGDLNATALNNTGLIEPLVALNVTDTIDYGIVPALNTSDEREANISNFGNTLINISVRGWGGDNESLYPNISMDCEYGNISLDLERYNTTSGTAWADMTNLTDVNRVIPGLMVNPRNDTDLMINKTYWRLRVPAGVGGLCNGTILFTASNSN